MDVRSVSLTILSMLSSATKKQPPEDDVFYKKNS